MVAAYPTVIQASPARTFHVIEKRTDGGSPETTSGERIDAVYQITRRWFERFGNELSADSNGGLSGKVKSVENLPVQLDVLDATPRHRGLGSGTQLAMATGIALQRYFGLPIPKPDELAIGLGRAARSAIGTYGCFEGGLLVDRGKTASEQVSPIDLRVDFPEHWPIAIVSVDEPTSQEASSPAGLHGVAEKEAFDRLPPTTARELLRMRALVAEQMVPGILEENYQRFAEALHEFGRRSGAYFAEIQGGPYASETISQVIDIARENNVLAAGQTSWGPSVFIIGQNEDHLRPAIDNLEKRFGSSCQIHITRADNQGVVVTQNTTTSA